jgi:hypothetical protein
MTWRWPSTAETCRHRQTNKYDPTTVVFWRIHQPSFALKHNGAGEPEDVNKEVGKRKSKDNFIYNQQSAAYVGYTYSHHQAETCSWLLIIDKVLFGLWVHILFYFYYITVWAYRCRLLVHSKISDKDFYTWIRSVQKYMVRSMPTPFEFISLFFSKRGAGIAQSVYRLVTGWAVRGSNPGPDRPWCPPNLLYNGYRVFPGGKGGRRVTLTTHPHLVPSSWKVRAIPLLPRWAHVACYRVTPYRNLLTQIHQQTSQNSYLTKKSNQPEDGS